MISYEESSKDALDWLFDSGDNASAQIGSLGAPRRGVGTPYGPESALQWLIEGSSDASGTGAGDRPGSEQVDLANVIEGLYPTLYSQGTWNGDLAGQEGYWAAEAYDLMAPEDTLTLPPAVVTAPSADVFDKPNAGASKLGTLKRYHSIDEIIEKRAVQVQSRKVWWYKIRYKDGNTAKLGWSKAENFSEIAPVDNFTFITTGGTGITSPFQKLREAVASANMESKIARLINYMNLVLLPQPDVTLANFVRGAFLSALIKTKGDFKQASLLMTAAVRAFKASKGGTFAWVQRNTATSGFDPAAFRDKVWHFFWNAYERFSGASAKWLKHKGLAYEITNLGWGALRLKDFDKDTEDDLIFNAGGVAFADWIMKNQTDVTRHIAGNIASKFRAMIEKHPQARNLSQTKKDALEHTLMADPSVEKETEQQSFRLYADFAGKHIEAVLEAIKKKDEGEAESLAEGLGDEPALAWLATEVSGYRPVATASGEAVEQRPTGSEAIVSPTSKLQAASWSNLPELFYLMRSLQEQQAPKANPGPIIPEGYEEAEIQEAMALLEELSSPEQLMIFPAGKRLSDLIQRAMKEVFRRAAKKWLDANRPLRNRFPNEPATNIDGLLTRDWVDKDAVFEHLKKHYNKQNAALTAADKARGLSRSPEQILGANPSTAISANYFVIHDTADTRERSDADVVNKAIHLFIGMVGLARSLDWHEPGLGTKIEARTNTCFVHIEMINATMDANVIKNASADTYPGADLSNERAAGSRFTLQQYDDLANAYIVASIRRGRFLTVTIHKEVDRSAVRRADVVNSRPKIRYGHNDPTDFDLNYFYERINQKLHLPAGTTYGIEALRVNTNNRTGQVNEFVNYVHGTVAAANQYGAVRSQNRHPSAPQGNAPSPPVKWPGAYMFPPHNASGTAVLNCGNGDWEQGPPSAVDVTPEGRLDV